MWVFEVISKEDCNDTLWGEYDCKKIIVSLPEGPYTDERILNKTGYDPDFVTIKDITPVEII